MGETVARYRWFAIFYLLFMFFLLPLYTFGLSLIGPVAIYVAFLPLLGTILILHPQFFPFLTPRLFSMMTVLVGKNLPCPWTYF